MDHVICQTQEQEVGMSPQCTEQAILDEVEILSCTVLGEWYDFG